MVLVSGQDYRSAGCRGFQIGVSRHPGGSLDRLRLIVIVGLAIVAFGGGPLAASAAAAAAPDHAVPTAPKVVLIVGPVGDVTPFYRKLADEAAAGASKLTTNVVKVYSPDATWENVKAALQGASVVVYLGHGNGWPSRYTNSLYPLSQDGFGLNPHVGAADSHQYFGEQQIGDQVKLAKDAVVIFSHLCYASGNTEPGLPEGTLDQAQQRVDNYAAGFFRAGAGAVIADSYLTPAYYVQAVLKAERSIDSIWRNAPNRNDHFLRFTSVRTKGAIAQMDPDNIASGFHRSIVLKARLTSSQVIGNAVRGPQIPVPIAEPTLAGLGVTFSAPDLTSPPTAGTHTTLTLPLTKQAAGLLPASLMIGTRWDRLDPGTGAPAAAVDLTVTPGASPSPAASSAPGLGASSAPGPTPSALPTASASGAVGSGPASTGGPMASATASASATQSAPPTASPAPSSAPATGGGEDPGTTAIDGGAIDLVVPERPGEIVAPVKATRLKSGGIAVPVTVPATPGLYRLVATVHQPDGVAYDAATQALIPALVVRVTGPITATYGAPAAARTSSGATFTLNVRVTNLGRDAWGELARDHGRGTPVFEPATQAVLVARWVDLGAAVGLSAAPSAVATMLLPAGLAPGASVAVPVQLTSPIGPGAYLIVLDVIDPVTGSLAAAGVPPGIVRVTVAG